MRRSVSLRDCRGTGGRAGARVGGFRLDGGAGDWTGFKTGARGSQRDEGDGGRGRGGRGSGGLARCDSAPGV